MNAFADGNKLFGNRDYAAAAAQYAAARRADPRNLRVMTAHVHALAHADRAEAAFEVDRYLEQPLSLSETASALATQLPYLESVSRETLGLSMFSAMDVNEAPFQFNGDAVERLRTVALAWFTEDGSVAAAELLAKAEYALGNYAACEDLLVRLRPEHFEERTSRAQFGPAFFAGLTGFVDSVASIMPRMKMITYPVHGRRIFIGCDVKYFRIYAEALVRSLMATTPDVSVHCHVFDTDGAAERAFLTQQCGARFSLSVETTPVANNPSLARYYYAAMRLVRFYQVNRLCPEPTLFLDADMWVGKSLTGLFDRMGDEVALYRMPGRLTLYAQMNASVVGIGTGSVAQEFLATAAGFVAKTINDGAAPWCLDQIALNCALRHMQRHSAWPVAVATGPEIEDGSFTACLWPQKIAVNSPRMVAWQAARTAFGGGDPAVAV